VKRRKKSWTLLTKGSLPQGHFLRLKISDREVIGSKWEEVAILGNALKDGLKNRTASERKRGLKRKFL